MTNPKSFKQKSGFRITKSTRSKFPLICFSKLLHKNSEISSRVDPYNSPPRPVYEAEGILEDESCSSGTEPGLWSHRFQGTDNGTERKKWCRLAEL